MPLDEKSYFTVSEINAQIRTIIEENYPDVTVLGEISNFKRHTSGHLYFTLKDADSQLRTVCFRSDAGRVTFEPEDGMRVLASGRLTLYEPYGQYQLVAYSLEEAGAGELERAFRELCEKLEKEGLFDPEHKKPLPVYPFRIAVVTSPTGAAVRDIISTLRRRWPPAEILLFPVAVQGENAAPEISRALGLLGGVEDLDLVITGRGGGSLEDLWAFNEEVVARAIFDCPIPVVSAVGHETDFTISDFVADVRAATPTMAAEIAVPQLDEILARLDERENRLLKYADVTVELRRRRLEELLRSYALGQVRGRVERAMQALDFATEKLIHRIVETVRERGNRLNETLTRLEGLDAKRILSRGYTICTEVDTGSVIRSCKAALEAGDVHVTFGDGKVYADVKELVDD
ncbi:MAG: exodeoxyribonuclease VII large subunit [Candidatus Latescibacterota bacterium]|nr:MAG: exodeoxyribonuclease VII large subunit [Candidatus Latescibacterota bacterium]